jgi:isochorismate synthase
MSLACLLHPTPALSGFPHQAAKRLIAELEPFDRQLFGGIVGWCDDEGNGEWVVTIRCARLQQRTCACLPARALFRPPRRWASGAKPASN